MTSRFSPKHFSFASLVSIGFLLAPGVSHAQTSPTQTDNPVMDAGQIMSETGNIPQAQLPDTVMPQAYDIQFKIDPQADTMTGTVSIDVNITEATKKIWLHANDMTVSSAKIVYETGQDYPLDFQKVPQEDAPSGVAYLTSETELPAGKAVIVMEYEATYNQSLNSAYQVRRGDDAYIVTQFEPLGARGAFPSFDEPRFKVPFTISIMAPKDQVVYANTPELGTKDVEIDGVTWTNHNFARTRPLPTYLIAFGVGPWDVVDYGILPKNSVRKKDLRLRGIAARGEGKNMTYALENTQGILTALEEYFGTPFPYEKLDLIAAPDYAFGAMENPGAIVYRESLLLLGDNPPLSQKRAYAGTHSHELAHQWFGDLVTPVWWEDIWLNEAFASWMGNKGISAWQPDGNFDRGTLRSALGAMNLDTLATTRKVREPLNRSENVMDQFDQITYSKGGGVLSMFESYVGKEKFRDGVRLHMKRYADGVATGDDFFKSIADGSGNPNVVPAMKSFVDQPGLPLVSGEVVQMGGADGKVTELQSAVMLTQSRYAPLGSKTVQGQLWQIPVCADFGYGEERVKSCELLKEKTGLIASPRKGEIADWVTLNENGSGYYRFTLDSQGWTNLINNLDKLNTREILTVQDSLEAAYRAGEVDSSVFLDGMSKLAKHPEYDVVSSSSALIGFMGDDLEGTSEDVARYIQENYADRYAQIAGTDTVEGNLLAPTLASLLVNRGHDEALATDLAEKGADYLGLNGEANKKAIAPNMLGLALDETMKSQGEAAYAPLLDLVENGSPFEKSSALGALTETQDKDIAQKILTLALDKDGPMTGRQSNSIVYGLLRSKKFGDMTWDWLKENFTQYVTDRVPDVRRGGLPSTGRSFCSLDRRDEVRDFMTENAEVIPGYERSLAQTLESIELCAALKEKKGAELKAALKAH
jgi:alanyl aminopeptidase